MSGQSEMELARGGSQEAQDGVGRVIQEATLLTELDEEYSGSNQLRARRRKPGKGDRINNEVWTQEEERLLFLYQEGMGNSWSQIARKLNRTDNAVKNHFYSTFRKSVRHINKFIKRYCRRIQLKTITNRNLLTILSACEEADNPDVIDSHLAERCIKIKKSMLKHSKELNEYDKDELISLISEFIQVTKEVKKQKNKYAQTIIKKIHLKATAPTKDPTPQHKVIAEKQAQDSPPAQPPIYMLRQLPSQTLMTQFQPQPQFLFQTHYDPSFYSLQPCQPQQVLYYMVTAPPALNTMLMQ